MTSRKYDPNYTGPLDPREPYIFPYIRQLHKAVHVTPRHVLQKKLRAALTPPQQA